MEIDNLTDYSNNTNGEVSMRLREGIDRYITPFWFAIGFPGNIISLIIWLHKSMRHSSGYYLAALALDDLIFLILHMVYEIQTTWQVKLLDYPVLCELYPIIYLASQYLSPFLVLAFTTERYISICHPFKREAYCTIKRAKIVIVCMAGFMPCLTAPLGYFFYVDYNLSTCTTRPEVTVGHSSSVVIIYTTTVEMLVFLVVPVTVLALNILVIREMKRLSRIEQTQLHGYSQRTGTTTVMLLAVSFYHIITTLPISITYAVYFEFTCDPSVPQQCQQKSELQSWAIYFLVLTIVKEYGITHYAFNIFIYLITGKMFREELKKMLLRPFVKLASTLPTDYTSLRTSVRGSDRSRTWVTVNGNHNANAIPNETLL